MGGEGFSLHAAERTKLQVGLGYLNRAELTAIRFVSHPQLGPCFRTGDIAQATEAGWELVGRSDTQVKLSGQRVELAEVEEALMAASSSGQWPLLQAVAVVVSKVAEGQSGAGIRQPRRPQLVAWCVPCDPTEAAHNTTTEVSNTAVVNIEAETHGQGQQLEALQRLLRILTNECLPRHMVPQRFAFIAELPTTQNGKVARSALISRPLPETTTSTSAELGNGDVSDNPTSSTLDTDTWLAATRGWISVAAKAWEEELGLSLADHGGAAADWMAMGGDSLGALRCCQHLAKSLQEASRGAAEASVDGGVFGELLGALSPAELMQHPRLCDYAEHLSRHMGGFPTFVSTNSGHTRHQKGALPEGGGPIGTANLDINSGEDKDGLSSLLFFAAGSGAARVVEFLINKRSVDVDGCKQPAHPSSRSATQPKKRSRTPLHLAASKGHTQCVRALVNRGASLNAPDQAGALPVHLAAAQGPAELLEVLLSAGANATTRDGSGQAVLHYAARANAPRKVWSALLQSVCSVSSASNSSGSRKGTTKGRGAGRKGRAPPPIRIDITDQWGRTPLHWAVVNGHSQAVQTLLEAGANTKAVDSAGETPLQIAERRAQCGAQDRAGARASVFGAIATQLGGSAKTIRGDKTKLFAGGQ